MAELSPKERLLPSLLDRLTDDRPGDQQETRDQRLDNRVRLRESVLRDLQWLMNTTNLAASIDLDEHEGLDSTVINYGLPGLTGNLLNSADRARLLAEIKRAVQAFEPRILENTLRIELIDDAELNNPNAIAFQIEGTLWGRPMPEALYLRTELDLELGSARVVDA